MRFLNVSVAMFVLIMIISELSFSQDNWKAKADKADSLRRSELYQASIPIYKEVLKNLDKNSEEFLKYKVRLGISYFMNTENDSALSQYKEVLVKTQLDSPNIYRAHAFNNMGVVFDNRGEFKKSIENYSRANRLYKKLGDSVMMDVSKMNIGIIYKKMGNYLKALENLTTSSQGLKRRQNNFQLAETYSSIGSIQEILGDYTKSLKFYRSAEELRIEMNDRLGLSSIYNNIGGVFKSKGEIDSAINYFRKSISISDGIKSRNLGLTLHNIALCYQIINKPELARKYFGDALNYKTEIGDSNELLITLNQYAQFEIDNSDYKKAHNLLSTGKIFAYKINNKKVLKSHYGVWKEYHKSINENDSALYYFELSEQLLREINNEKYLSELAKLQESFEASGREETINSLEQQNFQKDKKVEYLERNLSVILITFILVFIFYLIVLYILRQRAKNQKLVAKIKGIEQEKKRVSMELHDAVGSILKNLKIELDIPSNTKPLSSVRKKIENVSDEIIMISHSLYHPDIENGVFSEILEDMIYDWFEESSEKLNNDMKDIKKMNNFTKESKAHIYRSIQEILVNIKRHAKAKEVLISIIGLSDNIIITIIDDGSGINKVNKKGLGLKNLKTRIELLSGKFILEEQNNNMGTKAQITVPIKQNIINDRKRKN